LAHDREKTIQKSSTAQLPDSVHEYIKTVDKVGDGVKVWAEENCAMDDGLIPFLNIDQMAVNFQGTRFTIKNGIADLAHYNSFFNIGKGIFNFTCVCEKCRANRSKLASAIPRLV
jgi:hypothetical protein